MKDTSKIRTTMCIGLAVVGVAAAACDKGSSGDGAAPAATGAPAPAKTAATSAKAKVTLKNEDVKKAYDAAFNDMSKMKDPTDKKIEAFIAKIGPPEGEEGGKKKWHAIGGGECLKILLSKDGMKSEETVDKSECGM